VRFPPHAAAGIRSVLRAGAALAVRGEACTVLSAEVIEARAMGSSRARMKPLGPKPHHE
jgi:hypothetical protein